ncbi:MAG: hypothetical protein ACYS0E_15760 [Planctomycetota bacterium]|jgi:tetratricopeptide (TPR) repeat protein
MRSALVSLLVFAACASPPPPAEDSKPTSPSKDPVLADVEADRLLADKYYRLAYRFRDRGELLRARDAIRKALALQPDNEDYKRLEFTIEVNLGDRPATVALIANEAVASAQVKREEELVTVKRLLAEAERAVKQERWEQAKRAYERALFVLNTSRFREDAEFRAFSGPAAESLQSLPHARSEAERRQRESDLKELAR